MNRYSHIGVVFLSFLLVLVSGYFYHYSSTSFAGHCMMRSGSVRGSAFGYPGRPELPEGVGNTDAVLGFHGGGTTPAPGACYPPLGGTVEIGAPASAFPSLLLLKPLRI